MPSRPRPTLADYIVIGLSPALIMLLVGSLMFFLVEVFYQGQHGGRLTFIMAMFVMAAVSIARISIEEGRGYAALFALPLGGVVLLAMFRFVQFSGPFAVFSPLINIGLIALVWWCADKLTWDCTVIDEQKDASGEGLLQTVGLDAQAESEDASTSSPDIDSEATTGGETPEPVAGGIWNRIRENRRRPHAPGVWVVYFSLAALPIFGMGQWFIRSDDLASRRYVFQLLVVYVASALALLLTTSFLGLRRYLRQRRLEMPNEMATTWLGVGVVMIVGLLLFCLLLPRRNPEYSVTHLSWFAKSPDNLWTSKWGFGNDGPERDEANRTVQRDDGEQAAKDGGKQGGQQGDRNQGGQKKGSQQGGQQKGGQSERQQGGQSQRDQSRSGEQGQSRQQDGGQQQGKQAQGGQQQDRQQGGRQDGGRQDGGREQEGGRQPNSEQQNGGQQGDSRQGNQRESSGGRDANENRSNNEQQRQSRTASDSEKNSNGQQRKSNSQSSSQKDSSGSNSSQQQSSGRSFDPSQMFSQIGSFFGGFLKLAYWLVVLAIVGFLLWRYRAQVRAAIQQFLQALRELWERLFGSRQTLAESESSETAEPAPVGRPFSDFRDPFDSGQSAQMSVDELAQYSFQAFEAWSRDHGRPRDPDETPLEFAQSVAYDVRPLAREATTLGELYSRSAYGGGRLPQSALDHLARFWKRLTQIDRQPPAAARDRSQG